jgi:hypothetical protein
MKVRMTDLILNYFVDKQGKQTIKIILLHFDMIDRATIKDKKGKRQEIVPEVFGHIISNPGFRIKREITAAATKLPDFKSDPIKIEEEEKEEIINTGGSNN